MTKIHIPTFQEQLDLVEKKLAKKSVNPETGNITFKYTRDVMFKKKWYSEPNTMECRGHTYSSDGKLLVLPFRKTFNYGENDHWSDVSDDTELVAVIAAAIAAAEGTSTDGFVVRSIKRRQSNKWNKWN